MIRLYCRKNHKQNDLCADCHTLLAYAHQQLENCCFADAKPTCKKCIKHCYSAARRQEIKQVMRYSGPRLVFYDPLAFIKHILK